MRERVGSASVWKTCMTVYIHESTYIGQGRAGSPLTALARPLADNSLLIPGSQIMLRESLITEQPCDISSYPSSAAWCC